MARKAGEHRGRRRSFGVLRRSLGLLAFLPLASRAPAYTRLLLALVVDERVPGSRKALLAAAMGYLAVGRDLIPDDIPVLGGLDDLVVVVLAVDLFLDGIPADLMHEKLDELGIERAAFEQDIAQIRRLTPGPLRRAVRRLPRALDSATDALSHTAAAPRLRRWLTTEDSGS
jgi:uncharacterized membrane protein YkvA (DUF1232 family)